MSAGGAVLGLIAGAGQAAAMTKVTKGWHFVWAGLAVVFWPAWRWEVMLQCSGCLHSHAGRGDRTHPHAATRLGWACAPTAF